MVKFMKKVFAIALCAMFVVVAATTTLRKMGGVLAFRLWPELYHVRL